MIIGNVKGVNTDREYAFKLLRRLSVIGSFYLKTYLPFYLFLFL